jgi:hypothetical protein
MASKGIHMSKRSAIDNGSAGSSKKCFHCGLRNFALATRCVRCRYDVWEPLPGSEKKQRRAANPRRVGPLRAGVLISTAALLLGFAFLYIRQDATPAPEAVSQVVAEQPVSHDTEETSQVASQEDRQSPEAAKHVLGEMERFQLASESSMSYDQYDRSLTKLKADLNNTLPSFVEHGPGDETFRQEVDAAVREYTAAGKWWKTVEMNSSVLTDADRTERLIANWTSAKTHLDNAEQVLPR